jgi:hypothetical protein
VTPTVESVRKEIRSWSREVLEVANPHLSGMKACPFAEAGWKNDKVEVVKGDGVQCLKAAITGFDPLLKDMRIWVTFNLSRYELWDRWVTLWNQENAKNDLHLMLFHPEYPPEDGEVYLVDNDWQPDFDDDYVMVFIQSLSALNKASTALDKTGYYDKFPTHVYDSLVLERRRLQNGYG